MFVIFSTFLFPSLPLCYVSFHHPFFFFYISLPFHFISFVPFYRIYVVFFLAFSQKFSFFRICFPFIYLFFSFLLLSFQKKGSFDSFLLFYLKNLNFQKLVVKCDQLIKRRGKLGLIQVNADYDKVKQWISERINRDQKIQKAVGKLRNFIIEPFVPHADVSKKG